MVQSVLFDNDVTAVERALASLARATEIAVRSGACGGVTVRYGDSSSMPRLSDAAFAELRTKFGNAVTLEYDYFDGNLGSARGHNRLASNTTADFVLVQNPDVVVSPRLIERLLSCFATAGVGMAEAKQIPIEHPKDYDTRTGETSWATTACAMIPVRLFRQIGGFDAESFFLYCDDVDFSWLVRLAGFHVIFQPGAAAFHDKRLSATGAWQSSAAERYYSAEAALFLAHKWSRADLVDKYLNRFRRSGNQDHVKAAGVFEKRRKEGRLPATVDPGHRIGQFVDLFYAKHRYWL
ncbi:MAG: glycosyltransferase family 2 protein [Rhodopila sp.]